MKLTPFRSPPRPPRALTRRLSFDLRPKQSNLPCSLPLFFWKRILPAVSPEVRLREVDHRLGHRWARDERQPTPVPISPQVRGGGSPRRLESRRGQRRGGAFHGPRVRGDEKLSLACFVCVGYRQPRAHVLN